MPSSFKNINDSTFLDDESICEVISLFDLEYRISSYNDRFSEIVVEKMTVLKKSDTPFHGYTADINEA